MKLELPNGAALFLWEDEVSEITLHDSHIDITRPSGRTLKVRLSDIWLRNKSQNQKPAAQAQAPQALSSLPQSDLSQSSALALNQERAITLNSRKPGIDIQEKMNELNNAVQIFTKSREEHLNSIRILKDEMDTRCAELKENIKQIKEENTNELAKTEEKIHELSENFQIFSSSINEVNEIMMQMEESRQQSRKTKKI